MSASTRSGLRGLLALFATALVLHLTTLDLPLLTGMVHASAPDPSRPGRTMGVSVSPPFAAARLAGTIASIWLWSRLRASRSEGTG